MTRIQATIAQKLTTGSIWEHQRAPGQLWRIIQPPTPEDPDAVVAQSLLDSKTYRLTTACFCGREAY